MKMENMKSFVLTLGVLFITLLLTAQTKSFKPGEIWPDNNGDHINAHGGGFLFFEGKYYWFGEHRNKEKTEGSTSAGVRVYSSKNLYDWENEGIALAPVEDDPKHDITVGCVIERPKVIYNKKTKKFVMWFHLELKGQGYLAARTGLAVADKVTGPYTFVKSLRPNAGHWPMGFSTTQKELQYDANMKRWSPDGHEAVAAGVFVVRDYEGGQMSRDMTLFVDDHGKAYHIAASEENATLHIRELTDDYTGFTGKYIRVLPGDMNEAPALFKHQGKYYLLSSGCSGWKPNAGRSAVADNIWGPWTLLGNFARGTKEEEEVTFRTQSTYILPVEGMQNAYIYCSDRWQPDNLRNSPYIWLPIEFEDGKPVVRWTDEWNLSVFD